MELYIGIMSGTSMDGIDAVLVNFEGDKLRKIGDHSQNFPPDLKEELDSLLNNYKTELTKIGEIDHRLALCYAGTVHHLLDKVNIKPSEVKAVGCHGQTIFHSPGSRFPFTIQLGDGNLIAARTGIKTITDFRRMDMSFGGGGAPLVPAFHQAFLNDKKEKRCILNLGGIANITILADLEKNVSGYDTGPANCLMDEWIQSVKGEKFDKDGQWAKSGTVIDELLAGMMEEPYFKQPAPKSTGRELFNRDWLKNHLKASNISKNEDIQATLLELTALTVAQAMRQSAPQTNALYVCGGGAYNKQLLQRLSFHLKNVKIATTETLGISPQWVESTAFAWLAMRRLNNRYGNLPSVTGASQKVLLGTIYDPVTF